MDICLSGGAKGADLAWGEAAKAAGHKVIHYVFDKHKRQGEDVVVLTQPELDIADIYLRLANKTLKRSFPTRSGFVNNLLRRNYYQVKDTKRVYAIINGFQESYIDNPLTPVLGGTAWAVQMFLDRFAFPLQSLPIYAYDQSAGVWMEWVEGWRQYGNRKEDAPPEPSGVWTGIGTRDLTESGKKAISGLFGRYM